MAAPNEKTTTGIGGADPRSSPALNKPDANATSDSDMTTAEKPAHGVTEDMYPRGLNFVLLSGSAIIAIFLIALDQVRSPPRYLSRRTIFLTRMV